MEVSESTCPLSIHILEKRPFRRLSRTAAAHVGILRSERSNNIVNLEASDEVIKKLLLKAASAVFGKGKELIVWSATLPGTNYYLLRKNGFRFLTATDKRGAIFPPVILVRSHCRIGVANGFLATDTC